MGQPHSFSNSSPLHFHLLSLVLSYLILLFVAAQLYREAQKSPPPTHTHIHTLSQP